MRHSKGRWFGAALVIALLFCTGDGRAAYYNLAAFWRTPGGCTLWGWGSNSKGEIGLGYFSYWVGRNQIGTATDWAQVVGGWSYAMALKKDGTLWGTGDNTYGQLGQGYFTAGPNYGLNTLTQVPGTWANVSAGQDGQGYTMAIKTDGTLWGWGENMYGSISGPWAPWPYRVASPTQVGTDTDWAKVTAGVYSTLAIKTDGTLWGWGINSSGELGRGNWLTTQTREQSLGVNWAKVYLGRYHAVGIKTDGTIWAWGGYQFGALGLGPAPVNLNIPTQIGTDTNWASVSAQGDRFTMAIKTDGTLWAWGYNAYGQLGLGDNVNRYVPTQVGTETNWARVLVGGYWAGKTLALKTDGTLWAWGSGSTNGLGLGDQSNHNIPTQVGTDTKWVTVASGFAYGMAIKR